ATKAQSVHPCVDQPGACLAGAPQGRMGIIEPIGGDLLDSDPSNDPPAGCDAEIIWVMSDLCPIDIERKLDAVDLVRDITQNVDFTSALSAMDRFWNCYFSLDDATIELNNRFDFGSYQYFYSSKEPFPDVLVVVTDDVQLQGSSNLTGLGVIAYAVGFPPGVYDKYNEAQLLEWAGVAGTSDVFVVSDLQQMNDIIWRLGEMAWLDLFY
ncbi:unnamed protein product, partial [Owenia fusiformis]